MFQLNPVQNALRNFKIEMQTDPPILTGRLLNLRDCLVGFPLLCYSLITVPLALNSEHHTNAFEIHTQPNILFH